jgi:glucuronokinase
MAVGKFERYPRAGLVGNPSDGYYGKTISFSFGNFAAEVRIEESAGLVVGAGDACRCYDSLRGLASAVRQEGYAEEVKLAQGAVTCFGEYCDGAGHALHDRNFTLRFGSTIPRSVGLAGSSALVTAMVEALMGFYDVSIPKAELPNLVLRVENDELGIAGGLQDRVIQVYGGCVFMDFDRAIMEKQGYGVYEELDIALLPKFYIAYRTDVAESSAVYHNDLRERWNRGDGEVRRAMADFAGFAQESRDLIVAGRGGEIGSLLNANFALRRNLSELDPFNIEMVERAQSVGASAKFAGSGGAIVGTYEGDAMYEGIEGAFAGTGVVVIKPQVG